MKENVKKPIFRLTVSAVFIALSTVLSMIKIYEPPLGGGVTLFSMLPIIMLSCMFGIRWGLGISFDAPHDGNSENVYGKGGRNDDGKGFESDSFGRRA